MEKKTNGGKRVGAGRPKKTSETMTVVFTFDKAQWAALGVAFGKKGRHKFCHNVIDKELKFGT